MTDIILLIANIALILTACAIWMRTRLIMLKEYERSIDRFSLAANLLIENPETPERILIIIKELNEIIGAKNAARQMFNIVRRARQNVIKNPIPASRNKDESLFFQSHPEMEEKLHIVISSAISAAGYTQVFWGLATFLTFGDLITRTDTRKSESQLLKAFSSLQNKKVRKNNHEALTA